MENEENNSMNIHRIMATGKSGQIGSKLSGNIESIKGNLLSGEWKEENDFANVKTIVHLAGVVGNSKVNQDKNYAWKINVDATELFAKFIRDYSEARFLYVSSSHVYKPIRDIINEDSEVSPSHEYGKQKATAEEKIQTVFSKYPQRLKIVRVFSVLNLGMPEGTLGWAIERYLDRKINFSEDVRDFLTSKQIALIIEKLATQEFNDTIINICTGIPTSIKEAAHSLLGLGDALDQHLIPGNSDVPKILGNPSRMKLILGKNYENLKWDYLK